MRRARTAFKLGIFAAFLGGVVGLGLTGCGDRTPPAASGPAAKAPPPTAATPSATTAPPAAPPTSYCDFKGGPDDAKVKVVAYYPGRHEETLDAVKSLLTAFPGLVQVEIVDWRHEAGLKRRAATSLTCAGITINGKNAFDLTAGGKTTKVLFIRGINGEWSKDDLVAAVKQEIEATKGK